MVDVASYRMTTRIMVGGALALIAAAACADAPRDDARRGRTASVGPGDTATVHAPCAASVWEGVDTTGGTGRKVTRHPVNRGTLGMFAQVRWALSPDRCAMLVVHDPAAVEAEPVPNGFVHVSDRGLTLFQRDSVWDVSPSADWERLAYARAFGMQPGGAADSLSPPEQRRLAARVGLDEEVVRRGMFSCSGMTYAYCVARLHVVDRGTERALPVLAGWRVRWRADGSVLLAGLAPHGAQDHRPPARWVVVDPQTGAVRDTIGAADTAGIAPTRWSEGPMLSDGVALDLASPSEVRVDDGVIRSESGWIHVRWRGPGGAEQSFRVGAGRALAATRGSRFIAAIVPRRAPPEREWAYDVVVYRISR
jgi:hypothetical protein